MKMSLGAFKILVRESILMNEVTDPEKAAQRLVDLVRMTLKNRANGEPAFMGFMRNVGIGIQAIDLVRDITRKGNPVEAIAVARDVACAIFGFRPSSSSSSTSAGAADACDSGVAKKALARAVA
jgi:hypothetical protein